MNQNKKKMMKSKLKYYAQVVGVNLGDFGTHPCCCPYLRSRQAEEYLYPSLHPIAGDIRLLSGGSHRCNGWLLCWFLASFLG